MFWNIQEHELILNVKFVKNNRHAYGNRPDIAHEWVYVTLVIFLTFWAGKSKIKKIHIKLLVRSVIENVFYVQLSSFKSVVFLLTLH
jgi:hypothetical protein